MRFISTRKLGLTTIAMIACAPCTEGAEPSAIASLALTRTIELEGVQGRIDHLAVDLESHRLFVAELGNGSVDVIDVSTSSVQQRIANLDEPQGLAYSRRTQTLYVATGGDGVLHMYSGVTLRPGKSMEVGPDADNVRIDDQTSRIYVGSDDGIAIVNEADLTEAGRVKLKAHPESFQLQAGTNRMYVNVPRAKEIAVIDLSSRRQIASWGTNELSSNFALALDPLGQRAIAAFRQPARIAIYSMPQGKLLDSLELCGDADDLFLDGKRARIYVSCGEGFLDVFDARVGTVSRKERIATRPGARTSLYVPEWNLLFVAGRATEQHPAAILVYSVHD